MSANYIENLIFMLETAHIPARLEGILEDGRIIDFPYEGADSGCKNTLHSRRAVMVIFDHLVIRHSERRDISMRRTVFDLSFAL